ncbi:hypothetical protein Pint_11152 [Pistacia integerrima]|uniref:Uncharacterized protein n=1 Tax=Pistacia integerrima TaxID=434235 RepID=A0ACC0XK06_9ROSI|nr:hypothetical protein Pint_11152 [Pistacia integerrima]
MEHVIDLIDICERGFEWKAAFAMVYMYFIVKSCNRENLELSVQQGVWATQRSNEAKLNEAFDTAENVILIFSVNRTRHFQGCAKMTSKIGGSVGGGNWKYAHGTAHYGRNFSVKWLKFSILSTANATVILRNTLRTVLNDQYCFVILRLCELSFHKTRHLRNPYNENLPVKPHNWWFVEHPCFPLTLPEKAVLSAAMSWIWISRDCQELEPSIGEQLASLLYLEPDSELMAISVAAEAKREEEKAKGVNPENAGDNPDIVPFEDNEEEEEEESEEEDESFGSASQGRGRGRGMMWPPHMPLARGARPMPGMRGFPPVMMGADGFSYGPVAPEGFPMPDMFGVAPRAFPPYGPRFSGDFTGPTGMMFPGRPPQPGGVFPANGFGMMMGPGRAPFMGGMGPNATNPRAGRPVGVPPMFPPPPSSSQNTGRSSKRDQRAPNNDRNDRYSTGSDQGRGQEMAGPGGGLDDDTQYQQEGLKGHHEDQFGSGNFRNDESESEDEAPRRSRHGEGKKKRRGSEGEAGNSSDH